MHHILFVDDEPRILQGLRRMLYPRRREWDITVAASAADALAILATERVDVVVSDIRMPRMDGTAFLAIVRDRYPGVVRLVLTGHVDRDAALRTTAVAHRFLGKPCDAAALTEALERAVALFDLLGDESIRGVVGHIDAVPSASGIWAELQARLADPEVTVADLAAVIARDVAMSAKLLQIVNSAFLGLARELTRVEEAIAYLGLAMLRALVVTVEVFRSFDPATLPGFSADAVSRHGQASAVRAQRLASRETRDAAVAAAFLQDIGQLVLASCLPDEFGTVLEDARDRDVSAHVVERERWGFTHADVGAYLLGLWGLPDDVVDAVRHHHTPAHTSAGSIAEVVHAAHLLAQLEDPDGADPTEIRDADRIRALMG